MFGTVRIMRTCPKCKWQTTQADNIFCFGDGTKLIDTPVACQCGRAWDTLDKFCSSCGAKRDA